jgi:hypothetical protein
LLYDYTPQSRPEDWGVKSILRPIERTSVDGLLLVVTVYGIYGERYVWETALFPLTMEERESGWERTSAFRDSEIEARELHWATVERCCRCLDLDSSRYLRRRRRWR